MPTFDLTITEEQRHATLLALAALALERPGWDAMLSEIALVLRGADMYAEFKRLNADRGTRPGVRPGSLNAT